VSDGVLLAVHDEEPGADLALGRNHVDHCDECRARLAAIAARSSSVRASLSSIQIPPTAKEALRRRVAAARARPVIPRWRRPAWQAAAALIVVVGMAAASPVRQWVLRRLEQPRSDRRVSLPPPAAAPQASSRSGATVSFSPAGTELILRFDSLPDAGTLTVERTAAAEISARVVSGAGTGGDAMVVLPGELRVANRAMSRANYRVLLPRAVTRLRVIVADRTVFDGVPPSTIRLGPQR
jgi:hypothetical protein